MSIYRLAPNSTRGRRLFARCLRVRVKIAQKEGARRRLLKRAHQGGSAAPATRTALTVAATSGSRIENEWVDGLRTAAHADKVDETVSFDVQGLYPGIVNVIGHVRPTLAPNTVVVRSGYRNHRQQAKRENTDRYLPENHFSPHSHAEPDLGSTSFTRRTAH